jgi:hypothetical protein
MDIACTVRCEGDRVWLALVGWEPRSKNERNVLVKINNVVVIVVVFS